MRIHRLEIQAFGPFAGLEVVDFDALGAQGLFLLNGPTGAGKTSVLDAIAYALYGALPGARTDSLKKLRSDHAADGVGPVIVCEFSAGGRRLEVRRSPEWMRPAKRGTGTTKEQASTALREHVDGAWKVLSQRNDEAASEIQGLLGMSMDQFTKVILLAQGEFAAFLRASATDRQELLEKLFGTEIYQDLEQRLLADAAAATAQVADGVAALENLQEVARTQAGPVLATARQYAAGQDQPDAGGADPQAPAAGTDPAAGSPEASPTGQALFVALTTSLEEAVQAATAELTATQQEAAASRAAVAAAEQRQERHAVHAAVLTERDRLAGQAPTAEDWQQTLLRHHDAQVLASRVGAAERTAAAADAAAADVATAAAAFLAAPSAAAVTTDLTADPTRQPTDAVPSVPALERLETTLAGHLAEVTAALPGETRLVAARAELTAGTAALATATAEVEAQQQACDAGQARRQLATEEATRLRRDATPVPQAQAHAQQAQALLEAIDAHATQHLHVTALADAARAAHDRALTAKQGWLAAVEHRLSLAVEELAAALVDGEPCRVCGSAVHPAPAARAESGGDAQRAERQSQAASDAAAADQVLADTALAEARQDLAVVAARGGASDPAQAQAAAAAAQAALAAATADAERLARADAELAQTEAALSRAQTALLAASNTVAAVSANNAALERDIAALERSLTTARAGFASLAARQERTGRSHALTRELLAALRRQDTTAHAAEQARQELAEALTASNFADAAAVSTALVEAAEVAWLQERLTAHERASTLNTAQWEREDVVRAAVEHASGVGAPTPQELVELRERERQSARRVEEAAQILTLAQAAVEQVGVTAESFHTLEATVGPLRDRAALLGGVAEAIRGNGDNQLKMTLTSYVLAARLEQVALAASARLATMSGGRYALSHTDAKAGRNRKSGLGLEVVDEWTQRRRDTSTLSGGESFMASLALALGLADVVQQESGGLDIETLFVDEGFGSLDEESLDQVMDALEGLRDGGRVVGLVSHVAEMKTRIPIHLQVSKGRDGSTLAIGAA